MSVENIGKRLKSNLDLVMYERFPGSGITRTLPAGKPSPVITSYLANGYYQLKNSPEPLYLKKSNALQVVEPDAEDTSSTISAWSSAITDWISNTKNEAQKQAGFLADGFDKATGDLKTDFFNFNKTLMPLIWGVAIIMALYLANKFVK